MSTAKSYEELNAEKRRLDAVIGRSIQNERTFRRLSRRDLAKLVDTTTFRIGAIERGEKTATPLLLHKLAEVLDITMDRVFAKPRLRGAYIEKGLYYRTVLNMLQSFTEPELKYVAAIMMGIVTLNEDNAKPPEIEEA